MIRPSQNLRSILAGEESSQDENWMISYIDVFVLMTTLFVLLLSMEKPELGLGEAKVSTLNPEISESDMLEISPDALLQKLAEMPATNAGPDEQAERPIEYLPRTAAMELEETLELSISRHGLESHVKLKNNIDTTELEIQSRVLFDSGDAELTRSGIAVLENLLPILKQSEGTIYIEGHTDDKPIGTEKYPSNWDLASARATEVLQFFVLEGMDKSRFRAVSFGDTKPLAPNNSATNRQKNRRVSLVIHKAPNG